MSYRLIKVPLQDSSKIIQAVTGLTLPLGPLSANDATTLQVSVVVAQVTGGFTTANLSLEHSKDAGKTWSVVPSTVSDSITGAGTFGISLSDSSGILFPNVRLVVTVNTMGESLYLSEVYRTLTEGPNIIPRSSGGGGGGGVEGGATEATLSITNTKIDTVNTNLALVRPWPYVACNATTTSWNAGTFTETISFRTGGTGGTVVGTITTVYTDATRNQEVSTVFNPAKV